MDPTLEITAMPAPQWLFGYEISEEQRLLFARLYLRFVRSFFEGAIYEQPRNALSEFLDGCVDRGLQLAVPRELAIDILRRPDVFGWAPAFANLATRNPDNGGRSVVKRGRDLLARTNRRFAKRS